MNEPQIAHERLAEAYRKARAYLLAQQTHEGFWVGELATSALSTATAVCALTLVDRQRFPVLITGGVRWLLDHQREDGGWGDTVKSLSNISTTMLCRAALTLGKDVDQPSAPRIAESLRRAEDYLERVAGGRDPQIHAEAIRARYGKDRTFSVPILSCLCARGFA